MQYSLASCHFILGTASLVAEVDCLVGCCAVKSRVSRPKFQRCLLLSGRSYRVENRGSVLIERFFIYPFRPDQL
jgi:hypothetical protein